MSRSVRDWLLLLVVMAFAGPLFGGIELREAAILVQPAVVHVRARFHARVLYSTSSGATTYGPYEWSTSGSGFVFHENGLILSNAHVVEAGPDLIDRFRQYFIQNYVASIEQESGRDFSEGEIARLIGQIQSQGTLSLIDDEGLPILETDQIPREVVAILRSGDEEHRQAGKAVAAEVLAISGFEKRDLAILQIEANNLPTAPLGSSEAVGLQDELMILSFTGGPALAFDFGQVRSSASDLRLEMSEGVVTSLGHWRDGSPIFGTDASVAVGSSGGPAINDAGEVIGLLCIGEMTADQKAYGFNFLRPIDVAKEFIEASGLEAREGAVWPLFGEALHRLWDAEDLETAGQDREARAEARQAVLILREVLEIYPDHPDVARHLARGEAALQRLPQSLEVPRWLLGLGGVLLVALSLLLFYRRRQSPETTREIQFISTTDPDRRWMLVGESGPLADLTFPIEAEGLVIGRDPSRCQVVYEAETISREHARLQSGPEGLLLTNLSATNRTYLNDQPVEKTAIREGDRIRIGKVVFRIEV